MWDMLQYNTYSGVTPASGILPTIGSCILGNSGDLGFELIITRKEKL